MQQQTRQRLQQWLPLCPHHPRGWIKPAIFEASRFQDARIAAIRLKGEDRWQLYQGKGQSLTSTRPACLPAAKKLAGHGGNGAFMAETSKRCRVSLAIAAG